MNFGSLRAQCDELAFQGCKMIFFLFLLISFQIRIKCHIFMLINLTS